MESFDEIRKSTAVIGAFSTSMALADDAAALYKSKCAMCHGPNGEGKIGAKLQGTAVPEAQIVDMLTKGVAGKKAPHSKPLASVTPEQAKAVAAYIETLK